MAFTERYVVASGGVTSGSALTLATAWTFAHAVANAAAGDRINVENGTYTLSAPATLPNGASSNPIEWRGFHNTGGDESDIGNLENVGRPSPTAKLTTTNFPVIDGGSSYNVTNGSHSGVKNLHIKTSVNAFVYGNGPSSSNATIWRCKLEGLYTGTATCQAYSNGATYGSITDCDCSIQSTGHSAVVLCGRGSVLGCRIWNDSGSKGAGNDAGIDAGEVGSTAVGNVIFKVSRGISIHGNTHTIAKNTIFDVTNGFYIQAGGPPICDNIVYQYSSYMFSGTASGNVLAWNNAGETSRRINTSGLGSVFREVSPITLTADPFTNAGSEDFTLNNTAGGGALCRAASGLWGGFGDLGAVQHEDAGGGGTDYYDRGVQVGRWLQKAGRA